MALSVQIGYIMPEK